MFSLNYMLHPYSIVLHSQSTSHCKHAFAGSWKFCKPNLSVRTATLLSPRSLTWQVGVQSHAPGATGLSEGRVWFQILVQSDTGLPPTLQNFWKAGRFTFRFISLHCITLYADCIHTCSNGFRVTHNSLLQILISLSLPLSLSLYIEIYVAS